MQYRADTLGLSGALSLIFRDLIHERLGLFYEPAQLDQVADRLAPLVVARGLGSFLDYYYLLKYSGGDDEWLRVMDALAVQETYFWREIDQLRALVDEVVPPLLRRGEPLRIWSIPCATGEEPLTIAMLLDEAGWLHRYPIEILGSDASPAAIARAGAGLYGPRSFRNLPASMRERHFTAAGDRWQVSGRLRDAVHYDVCNLMDEAQVGRHAPVPIVLCRNLFIYFSDASIGRALRTLEAAMPPRAWLCVGASESLLRRTTAFELQEIGGAFMYVRRTPAGQSSAPPSAVERAS